MGGFVLLVGAISGLGTIWLLGGAALAGGFGWMLGDLPTGASGPGIHTGAGQEGGAAGDGGNA
jgi:hypothetical protein